MSKSPTLEQWGFAMNTASVELAPLSNMNDAALCCTSKLEADFVN